MQKQDQTAEETPCPKCDEEAKAKAEPKKEKVKLPTAEEVRAAVAGVVLVELEMWPHDIQVLCGNDHPNEKSFDRGVPYVIGAYMHIVRDKLADQFDLDEEELGRAAARYISPTAVALKELQKVEREAHEQLIRELNEEEQEKLKIVTSAIKTEYEQLRSIARADPPSEDVMKLAEGVGRIQSEFNHRQSELRHQRHLLLKKVEDIETAADDWNSKGRKRRRKEHRQPKKSEVGSNSR